MSASDDQSKVIDQAVERLTSSKEMGELFKVMALGKEIDPVALGGIIGFRYLDQRRHL